MYDWLWGVLQRVLGLHYPAQEKRKTETDFFLQKETGEQLWLAGFSALETGALEQRCIQHRIHPIHNCSGMYYKGALEVLELHLLWLSCGGEIIFCKEKVIAALPYLIEPYLLLFGQTNE